MKVETERIRIEPSHPNTNTLYLREDSLPENIDLSSVPEGRIPSLKALKEFAESQIETYPHHEKPHSREDFLDYLRDGHPINTVPSLISLEPVMMLSNLSLSELRSLQRILHNTEEGEKTWRAQYMVQGVIIGMTAQKRKD